MKLLIIIILLIIFLGVLYWLNYKKMTFIQSPIDNHYYMVRDLADKYIAVNLLSTLRNNAINLIKYLDSKKDTDYKDYKDYINQLNERMKDVTISETKGDDTDNVDNVKTDNITSYSVNKGEELVICLRSKKDWNKFHKINVLMYVMLHEISHIACPEYGHGKLYKKIFEFITKTALELKMYEYIDFSSYPEEYCGIMITDSII